MWKKRKKYLPRQKMIFGVIDLMERRSSKFQTIRFTHGQKKVIASPTRNKINARRVEQQDIDKKFKIS